MKRNTVLFLLSLVCIVFALVSCDNGNGGDDTHDPEKIYLVDDGEVSFQFVYSQESSAVFRQYVIDEVSALSNKGISVKAVSDADTDSIMDREVLVGSFTGREDYSISKYSLGKRGYTVRAVDEKIVILGGTEAATMEAFDLFIADCMKFDVGTMNVTVDKNYDVTHRPNYAIRSVTLGGEDILNSHLFIECDTENYETMRSAELLQNFMYDRAGIYFEIVRDDDAALIKIRTEPKSDSDGFAVYTENGVVNITCQYPMFFVSEVEAYIKKLAGSVEDGVLKLDMGYSKYMHVITYQEYGAVGDGVHDDFDAIKAAHEAANKYGLKIDACGDRKNDGLVFNMGAHADTVKIMTDVDWTGASFIIDDSDISGGSPTSKSSVFSIVNSSADVMNINGSITSLSVSDVNVGITLDRKYLMHIYNSNSRQYIRYGINEDEGGAQQEIILVNENGDIDKSTPLLWDYTDVTYVALYPADDVPITVLGGKFLTIANQAPRRYTYFSRNIKISRSNVTVKGAIHQITSEGDSGAPYDGFFNAVNANNVLFEDIVFSGHKTYKLETNENNSMGSYDIAAANSNAVTWRGCTQLNSIMDTTLWGIMGSNYCKNLTYDGCCLSRFDAHKGMYNTGIINSTIGHGGITAIGAGYLRIENTTVNGNRVVSLRDDYGSTWNGEVILKNVTLNNTSSSVTLISGNWHDHNFGYKCHLPNVTVDNLCINGSGAVYVFSSFGNKNIADESTSNPVSIGGKVVIKNNNKEYSFVISSNSYLRSRISVTYE